MIDANKANSARLLSLLPSFSVKEEQQQQQQQQPQQEKGSTMVNMPRKHSLCADTTRTDTTERSSSFSCHSLVEGEHVEDDGSASSSAASFEDEEADDDEDDEFMFATQQDVTNLLRDIHQRITDTQAQQDELQASMDECWTLAQTRYTAGSIVTTRIALKRRHAKRLKLGRLAAQQCAFLEMYNDVQDEWQRAQSFVTSTDCLVDVDVAFYRRALAQVEEETTQTTAPAALEWTMPELWEELQEIVV
eukprot:scaffold9085_cov215-Amphora_coffeaeformis.AAC.16